MSLHTRFFAGSTAVLAVVACTIVAFNLPTLLDFTGLQVEMLRSALQVVPAIACITGLCYGLDLIRKED